MTKIIEIEITDCLDCPFRHLYDFTDTYFYCDHPKLKEKDDEFFLWEAGKNFKSIPEWCPVFGGE